MTDRYAVFGNPIAHSKSPEIHRLFAEQTGEDIRYDKQLVEPDNFVGAADAFFADGGKGLNITLPFKTDAYSYAHRKTERARRAGAVNLLSLAEDGTILGDNTDGFGLLADLQERLNWPVAGRDVLLLGAGGAVRGVLGPLLEAGPGKVVITNRTRQKAVALAKAFAAMGSIEAMGMDELAGHHFQLVINGTSTGVSGEGLSLPDSIFAEEAYGYDMAYGTEPTPFLRWSAPHVREGSDGLGMLVAQAAESFRIWRGKMPDFVKVLAQLNKANQASS